MQFEIIEVGPRLVERFERDTVQEAVNHLLTYDPNPSNPPRFNLFILPYRYRVDPNNPNDAAVWNRRGNYFSRR